MPDATTPQATPTDAPPMGEAPAEDHWRPDLSALRARLDALDDQIQDLLIDRALVIENVARSGKPAAFRPGREAAMLRRLLARHKGGLPARTIVRMWREMLAGTTAMQAAIRVAVHEPAGDATFAALAREHFGCLTPVIPHGSIVTALHAVRSGEAAVAVLPFPSGAAAWWPELSNAAPRLHVVARLPFWTARPPFVPTADALAVAVAAPDASGCDRGFIAGAERGRLADAGFVVLDMHGDVAEVATLPADDDKRLPPGAIMLGGYAVPLAGDQS